MAQRLGSEAHEAGEELFTTYGARRASRGLLTVCLKVEYAPLQDLWHRLGPLIEMPVRFYSSSQG